VCVRWVTKVAIVASASNKPEQAGEFGKPDWRVRITDPTLRTMGQTPHRILDKVTESKRINSRLNERELATLRKRRGRTSVSNQIVSANEGDK